MRPRLKIHLLFTICVLCLPLSSYASSDPVTTFIVVADSLAQTGDDVALAAFVTAHKSIVGAAVGQLLDVGFEVGQAGDTNAEAENVAFGERIAKLHWESTGSVVPLEIVQIYRRWTAEDRAVRARAKALETEAFELQKAGDYGGAADLFHRVIDSASKIDDRRTIAVTWGSLGVVKWYQGEMDSVRDNYERALAARRAIEDRILEGRTLNGLGSTHWRLGDYEEAIRYYDQAVDCRRETGDLAAMGISLTYRGNCYYQMGRLIDARKSFERAYAVLEEHGSPQQMIEVLNSMANIHSGMGRLNDASAAYRRAIDLASTVDRPQDEAACRINLADNLRIQGRFREALAELDRVATLLDRVPEPEKTADFFRQRAKVYVEMGEYDEARDALLECLEVSRTLPDRFYEGQTLVTLGELYMRLGAGGHALEMAKQAEALAGETSSDRLLMDAFVLAARAEEMMGHPEVALRHRERAREKNLELGAVGPVLDDDVAIASYRASLGQVKEAREGFYDVLPRAREARRTDLEWTVHFGIGHTFQGENPDSAARHYDRAISIIEESRGEIGGAETRTGFLGGKRRFYFEEVARYYVSLDSIEPGKWSERGFETIEKAKARGLLDLLENSVLVGTSPAEDALLDSLYSIGGKGADAQEAKRNLEKRYLDVREERLRAGAGRIDLGAPVASIDDVRKTLPKKTVLLEYALGDTLSLLWVIDRNGFEVFELPARETLSVDVQGLRDAVQRPGAGDEMLREKSRALYESLLGPAENRIAQAERMVIVPDGFLFEVPFEALLVDDASSEADWRDLPYLTRIFDTVYAPSASTFLMISRAKKQKDYETQLVAFGDPDLARFSSGPAMGLPELPQSRSEVERIGSRIPSEEKKLFLGDEATESRLKWLVRSADAPRILHLATHGLVDRAEPSASCVVLTPDIGEGDDGYLHTLEIFSLPLDVRLAVLSACESARGRVGRGEGVVGLGRAFLASGAAGVVASLWKVSDESTSELMAIFYDQMFGGKRPAARALREARLTLLQDDSYAHPFYWSPFVIVGALDTPW